ncbi:MAG: hypothetical protein ABI432_05685 [Flavobacteriales bacterium]
MRRASTSFFFAFVATACVAQMVNPGEGSDQAITFATYADYQTAKGDTVGTYVDLVPSMGQHNLVFSRNGEKHKVPCKDLWGFVFKGVLFRIEDEFHLPVRLMTKGTVCYYENGYAHLMMQRDGTEHSFYDIGYQNYLSHDLESPIVRAIFKTDDRSASGKFRAAFPQYEPLCACIGDRDELDHTRQCVVDYEASLEKE